MANSNSKSSLLYLVLLTFIPTIAISSYHGLKSLHFTLYQHYIFNKTDFIIIPGVAGANLSAIGTAPFGTITLLRDNLTLTTDPSSKVAGDAEALTIVSSFDGFDSLTVTRFALDLEDGHSGTISIVGVVNTLKASDVPITGGTGDFLLVQGYVTNLFVSFDGVTFIYKVDFHLYWPPYAPYAIKG